MFDFAVPEKPFYNYTIYDDSSVKIQLSTQTEFADDEHQDFIVFGFNEGTYPRYCHSVNHYHLHCNLYDCWNDTHCDNVNSKTTHVNHMFRYRIKLTNVIPEYFIQFSLNWISTGQNFFVRVFYVYNQYYDTGLGKYVQKKIEQDQFQVTEVVRYIGQFNIDHSWPVEVNRARASLQTLLGYYVRTDNNMLPMLVHFTANGQTLTQICYLEVIDKIKYVFDENDNLLIEAPGYFLEIIVTWGDADIVILDSIFGQQREPKKYTIFGPTEQAIY